MGLYEASPVFDLTVGNAEEGVFIRETKRQIWKAGIFIPRGWQIVSIFIIQVKATIILLCLYSKSIYIIWFLSSLWK